MSQSMEDYRYRLITEILFANSLEEVTGHCHLVIHELEDKQTPAHLIAKFLQKTVSELLILRPLTQNSQQWTNIMNATDLCNRLTKQYPLSHE
jgi:hypothetical protein